VADDEIASLMKTFSSFLIVLLIGFSGCSLFHKHKKKDPTTVANEEKLAQESQQQDFQGFIGRLRKAVKTRDMTTIATMMVPDFAYRLGATPAEDLKGDGVFKYWDDNNLWEELDGILSEQFVPKNDFMVAPPQFADENLNYDGYRAGVRRVNGSWKFIYFVNGY
jgi:hypothetical protein